MTGSPPFNRTHLFPDSPTHTSDWVFPPPVSAEFLWIWYNEVLMRSPAADSPRAGQYFEIEASKNWTQIDAKEFGSSHVIVHAGDLIEVDWTLDINDVVRKRETPTKRQNFSWQKGIKINCLICSTGQGDGTVYEACNNYTDTAHLSEFYDTIDVQTPNKPLVLPSLSNNKVLPEEAVGLCYLVLLPGGMSSYDFTIPFPVAQSPRPTHYRYRKSEPLGVMDDGFAGSIVATAGPTPEATSAPTAADVESSDGGGSGTTLSHGSIVGIAMGVVAGILISAVLGWLVIRRERRKRRKVSDEASEQVGIDGVELQRVQRGGVERRVDRDDDGEAPPAYHEVMRQEGARDEPRQS